MEIILILIIVIAESLYLNKYLEERNKKLHNKLDTYYKEIKEILKNKDEN